MASNNEVSDRSVLPIFREESGNVLIPRTTENDDESARMEKVDFNADFRLYKSGIQSAVKLHQLVIISADPYYDVSSEVCQYVYEGTMKYSNWCRIIFTTPYTLIAGKTVKKITSDKKEPELIAGYILPFTTKRTPFTSVIATTFTSLMDKLLSKSLADLSVTHLIVDVIRETTSLQSLVYSILKDVLIYSNVKVVLLTSIQAFRDIDRYFNGCAFPIQTSTGWRIIQEVCIEKLQANLVQRYGDVKEMDIIKYIDYGYIAKAIVYLHEIDHRKGDIVILLPTFMDVFELKRLLKQNANLLCENGGPFYVFCIYSDESQTNAQRMLEDIPTDTKNIILCTDEMARCYNGRNVKYVIDTPRMMESKLCFANGSFIKELTWATKQCVRERRYCSSQSDGCVLIHLYSYETYSEFALGEGLHEDKECSIQKLCLYACMQQRQGCSISDYILRLLNSPPSTAVKRTLLVLRKLGAIDELEEITPLGLMLSQLPVEPMYGKMLISALVLKCLDPVLTIVACLTHNFLFDAETLSKLNINPQLAAATWMNTSMRSLSDHFVMLKLYMCRQDAGLNNNNTSYDWCSAHYVQDSLVERANGTRCDILTHLRSIFADNPKLLDMHTVNSNSHNWTAVKACLVSGYGANIICKTDTQLIHWMETNAVVDPMSVLMNTCNYWLTAAASPWIVYDRMYYSVNEYKNTAFTCTTVTPLMVAIFATTGEVTYRSKNPQFWYEWSPNFNRKVSIQMDPDCCQITEKYQNVWLNEFNYIVMKCPSDDSDIGDLMDILQRQEEKYNLSINWNTETRPPKYSANVDDQILPKSVLNAQRRRRN